MDNIYIRKQGNVLLINEEQTIPIGTYRVYKNDTLNTISLRGIFGYKINYVFNNNKLIIDNQTLSLQEAFEYFVKYSSFEVTGASTEGFATIEYVDEKIDSLSVLGLLYVDELPSVDIAKENIIYLVPVEGETYKNEYILIKTEEHPEGKWELIGSPEIDLVQYVKFDSVAFTNKLDKVNNDTNDRLIYIASPNGSQNTIRISQEWSDFESLSNNDSIPTADLIASYMNEYYGKVKSINGVFPTPNNKGNLVLKTSAFENDGSDGVHPYVTTLELGEKVNVNEVYNVEETDVLLDLKADKVNTYTMDQVDDELALKADKINTYTKQEVDAKDTLIDNKIAYKTDKVYVDSELGLKADKTYVGDALDLKADKSDTYTKQEIVDRLLLKADKTYVDDELGLKVGVDNVYLKTESYNQTEIDTFLGVISSDLNTKVNVGDIYSKPEIDATFDTKADIEYVDNNFGKVKSVNDVLPDDSGNVVIEIGGDSPLLKKAVGVSASYYLDDNVEPNPYTSVIDLRIGGIMQLGNFAVALGSSNNVASGQFSSVTGGNQNTASGSTSTVTGGYNNTAYGYSTVSGGSNNSASGQFSSVTGGTSNKATAQYSSVIGGAFNVAFNYSETVVGMFSTTGITQTTIVLGSPIFRVGIGSASNYRQDGFIVTNEGLIQAPHLNTMLASKGGDDSLVTKKYVDDKAVPAPIIKKGEGITASYYLDGNVEPTNTSVIDLRIGGISELYEGSVALGGNYNTASGSFSTVSGGNNNTASGSLSTVSGGYNNTASDQYSTVTGGVSNVASGSWSTVSGGGTNKATGGYSTVSGGGTNNASGSWSTVSGGLSNKATGGWSTVSGGSYNKATGDWSTVTGGVNNMAFNWGETVVGVYSTTGTAQSSRVKGSPIFRVGIGDETYGGNLKDGFIVSNTGLITAPHQTIDLTTDPKQLTTKEYVDSKIPETSNYIEDAPLDGKLYGRKDAEWSEVIIPSIDLGYGLHFDSNNKIIVGNKLDNVVLSAGSIDLSYSNVSTPQTVGASAFKMGFNVEASADTSVAFGYSTKAKGYASFVAGYLNEVNGNYSVAIGSKNKNNSECSTVFGFSNVVSGIASTAVGYTNKATGHSSTALGTNNESNGSASLTSGENNISNGRYSTSFGLGNTTNAYASLVIGQYSTHSGDINNINDIILGNPIFKVGVGTSNTDRKDGFIVTNDGKVEAPHLEVDMIVNPKQLVTKEYVDTISGVNTKGEFSIPVVGDNFDIPIDENVFINISNKTSINAQVNIKTISPKEVTYHYTTHRGTSSKTNDKIKYLLDGEQNIDNLLYLDGSEVSKIVYKTLSGFKVLNFWCMEGGATCHYWINNI